MYYDKSYYLAPDKGAAKPYALLVQALRETERCAIARWASRGQANLVMLRPVENTLMMQQLHFAAEVRAASEIEVPQHDVKSSELNLAKQLIEQQASKKFDAAAYVDEVKGRIEAAIQKKVEGQEISIAEAPTESGTGKVIDLMEALRASLEKSQKAKATVSQLGPRKAAKRVEPAARTARKSGKR